MRMQHHSWRVSVATVGVVPNDRMADAVEMYAELVTPPGVRRKHNLGHLAPAVLSALQDENLLHRRIQHQDDQRRERHSTEGLLWWCTVNAGRPGLSWFPMHMRKSRSRLSGHPAKARASPSYCCGCRYCQKVMKHGMERDGACWMDASFSLGDAVLGNRRFDFQRVLFEVAITYRQVLFRSAPGGRFRVRGAAR
jgi:hypothetical protein